jgi:hypothetical protein
MQRRVSLAVVGLCLWATPAVAVIAFDNSSCGTQSTGNISWDHTPVGTPAGVVVGIVQSIEGVDNVSGVTYDGEAMTEVAGSPFLRTSHNEDATLYLYFLGSGVNATSPATVAVTVTGGRPKSPCVWTLTAAADTEIEGDPQSNVDFGDTVTSGTLTFSTANTTVNFLVALSGNNAASGPACAADTEITTQEEIHAASTAEHCRSDGTEAAGSPTAVINQSADDLAMAGVAIREAAAGATLACTPGLGIAPCFN